jgi:hypothetical protein
VIANDESSGRAIVVDRGELVKGGEAGNGTEHMLVDAFGELPDVKLLLKSVLAKPHITKV